MNLTSLHQACIYTGVIQEGDLRYRYLAIYFSSTRQPARGGFPKEVANLLDLLQIPHEPHWNSKMNRLGWRSSYHVHGKTYDVESQLPPVDTKATELFSGTIKNESALFLLRE